MLKVSDLNTYYGESHVLRDVSVFVDKGEVVVMLGPNGHGKSTLLKSVCGLVEDVTGTITYQDKSINGLATENIVNLGLIYIAENRELFPNMTVVENLKMGAYSKNARPHEKENLEWVFDLFPRLVERRKQLAAERDQAGELTDVARLEWRKRQVKGVVVADQPIEFGRPKQRQFRS